MIDVANATMLSSCTALTKQLHSTPRDVEKIKHLEGLVICGDRDVIRSSEPA